MAAVALEQVGLRLQGGEEIEAPVGAGAGLPLLAVQADEVGRAAEFLGQAGGHNADDALVPALAGQDDGVAGLVSRQHGQRLLVDLRLHLLALAVELAELAGELLGSGFVPGEEELGGQSHLSHAPGGVDPGGEGVADGGGGEAAAVAAALCHERGETRPGTTGQGLESPEHEGAVFPGEGHDVGHGAKAQ